jgi:aspartate dehydrogenase
MRLGLIGYGNIAAALLDVLADEAMAVDGLEVLARPGGTARAQARLAGAAERLGVTLAVHERVEDFVAAGPTLAVEVATHEALRDALPACLRVGIEGIAASIGALADPATEAALRQAARAGNTRLRLVPGAVGGIDALAAARLSGGLEVSYTGRKPPRAWAGTPAEAATDLAALDAECAFYEGTAGGAARDYPKNANVAATLALAGAGFEATRVRLVADPAAPGNIHEYSVRSNALNFTVRLEGKPSPDNPKTSLSTVYSVAREILNAAGPISI